MQLFQRNPRRGTIRMDPSDSGTRKHRLGKENSQTRLAVAVVSCFFFVMSMNSFNGTDVYTDLDVYLRASPSEASALATSSENEKTNENKDAADGTVANLQIDLDPKANVFPACTSEELALMQPQIKSPERQTSCPEPNWIEDLYYFYQDGQELGSKDGSFLGITIGCNKAFDAINTARMGMNNPVFSKEQWKDKLESYGVAVGGACKQDSTPHFELKTSEPRPGEMHCVEPMPSTVEMLSKAATELNLGQEGFVVTKAAISSRDGKVYFPRAKTAGVENINMDGCNSKHKGCEEVPMYSLQTYVENYVKSTGPINILSVDVEGFDFDVLFGAGSVLDRTQYLEFEYHKVGHWGKLHVHDLVNLLDLKGFNCYWAGREKLWRITNCQLEKFDTWHGWSNVACVHRSQNKLAQNMENIFLATIAKTKPPS